MKKLALVLSLALVVTLCLAQSPPMPPGYVAPKKKVVLMSPKHASQLSVRMKVAAAPMALAAGAPTSGTTATFVPVTLAFTDGNTVTNTSIVTALRFTSPNPLGNHYTIFVSDDLNVWTNIKMGTADDPLVLYDFTYLTQKQLFYKFTVDTAP